MTTKGCQHSPPVLFTTVVSLRNASISFTFQLPFKYCSVSNGGGGWADALRIKKQILKCSIIWMKSGLNVPEALKCASLSQPASLHNPQRTADSVRNFSTGVTSHFRGSCSTGHALSTPTVIQYVAYDFMMQRTQLVTTYLTYASTEPHENGYFRSYLHDSSHLEGPTHNT